MINNNLCSFSLHIWRLCFCLFVCFISKVLFVWGIFMNSVFCVTTNAHFSLLISHWHRYVLLKDKTLCAFRLLPFVLQLDLLNSKDGATAVTKINSELQKSTGLLKQQFFLLPVNQQNCGWLQLNIVLGRFKCHSTLHYVLLQLIGEVIFDTTKLILGEEKRRSNLLVLGTHSAFL